MKIIAVKIETIFITEEMLPELSNFSTLSQLNKFLDTDAGIPLRLKIFEMALSESTKDENDCFANIEALFEED